MEGFTKVAEAIAEEIRAAEKRGAEQARAQVEADAMVKAKAEFRAELPTHIEQAVANARSEMDFELARARDEGQQEGIAQKHRQLIADREKYEERLKTVKVESWQQGFDAGVESCSSN